MTGAEPPAAQGHRLKAAINAGQKKDKVAFPDPAAAPLGTDDEAAGQTATAGNPAGGDITTPPEPGGDAAFRDPAGEVRWHPRLLLLVLAGAVLAGLLVLALFILSA